MQVTSFVSDQVRPSLVAYDLDLTGEIIRFTFSETVDISTLDINQFTLHQTEVGALDRDFFTFTGGFVNSMDSPIFEVELLISDLNMIRENYELAVSHNTTFLSFTELAKHLSLIHI